MKKLILLLGMSLSTLSFAQKDTLSVMSLNLLNYPNGCGTGVDNREDTLRKICQYVQPDILGVCELQEEFGADSILNRSLNVFGTTHYARANWVLNASSSNNFQNMLFYNTDKLSLQSQDEIVTSLRDINHYVLYVNDPYLNVHNDTIFLEVYVCHLKAGTGSANENERDIMAQLIRNYVDARPAGRNHILCGDFNVYDDQEPGYITLTSGGSDPFFDPINQAGDWHDNAAFASIHTQSPRTITLDCGAAGGMDDRFDQILVTQNVMNGSDSVTYVDGTYEAVGQDGQHFDGDLLSAPSNSMYPDSIVNAVYYMSDHLPIAMDIAISKAWDDVALSSSVTHPQCNGDANGEITINPSGGTAPYTYEWDANAGNQTTATVSNLASGTYCVVVSDDNGYQDSVCISLSPQSTISLSSSSVAETSNCNGSATVSPTGGIAPYVYQWDANAGNQSTATADNLCAGDYWVVVTDANGCQDSIQVNVANDTGVGLNAENPLLDAKIFPNPFDEELKIDLSQLTAVTNVDLILYDLQGRIVYETQIKKGEFDETVSIKTGQLGNGTYLLELSSDGALLQLKVIK